MIGRFALTVLTAASFGCAAEVVVDFESAVVLHPDTKANRVEKWEEKGVTFQLAHAPRKSKAKGLLGFFAHLPSERKGIVSAMALEAIPVRATFPAAVSSVTLSLWGSTGTPAVVEAFDASGALVDRAAVDAAPAKKSAADGIPVFTLSVKGKRIAYVEFSGPRAGEYLVADEVRFTPVVD